MRDLLLALLALALRHRRADARGARHRGYRVNVLRRAALGLMLALVLAPQALADGDPASDILAPADARVYMTLGATDPSLEKQLAATTQQVTDAGPADQGRGDRQQDRPRRRAPALGQAADLRALPRLRAPLHLQGHAPGRDAAGLRHQRALPPAQGARGAPGHRSAQGPDPARASRIRPTRRCARSPRQTATTSAAEAAAAAAACRCR